MTTSLKKLGLRIQLGHQFGEKCLNPEHCTNDDLIIIDTHGIHEVGIDFCSCGKSDQRHTVQLLCTKLFPAMIKQPKMAATTRVLELFELLGYKSKASTFEFYHTLSWFTENTGISFPRVSYFTSGAFWLRANKSTKFQLILGPLSCLFAYGTWMATFEDAQAHRKRTQSQWHCSNEARRMCCVMSCMSTARQKHDTRMGKWISFMQVSNHLWGFIVKFQWPKCPDIFTPSLLPLMQTFGWSTKMFPVMKQILAWVRGGHISLRTPDTKHISSNMQMTQYQYARPLSKYTIDTDPNFLEKHMFLSQCSKPGWFKTWPMLCSDWNWGDHLLPWH